MSDVELIEKIKLKDDEAFKTLLKIYEALIYLHVHSIIKTYSSGDFKLPIEDLFQEGTIALYDACLSYKHDKNTKFSSFAYMVIERRLLNFAKKSYKNIALNSYDKTGFLNMSEFASYVNEPSTIYNTKQKLNKVLNYITKLEGEEYDVIMLRMKSLSYRQIANKLNITEKKVDNTLAKIRKRLKTTNEFKNSDVLK